MTWYNKYIKYKNKYTDLQSTYLNITNEDIKNKDI